MKRSSFLRLAAVAPLWLRHAIAGGEPVGARGLRAAARSWLLSRQSADGAWRSDTYGAFADGRALTPVVLRALAAAGEHVEPAGTDRACRWLLDHWETLFEDYAVHLCSAVLESAGSFYQLAPLVEIARERLISLQCPESGGWSYSPVPPPAAGAVAPMQQANLAATVMAIDGLRAAGSPAGDPLLRRALGFVRSCQNHGTGDDAYDDGGFFQIPGDVSRNKAGISGKDGSGEIRFHSYASATADGLRALLLCGESGESAAVRAAGGWLRRFRWSPDGSPRGPADLIYYTARSMRCTSRHYPALAPQCAGVSAKLAAIRQADGSWRNPAGEMREDCPVVATALALEALVDRAPE